MKEEFKPYYLKESDRELSCDIDDDGVIRIHMEGNLSSDYVDDLFVWAETLRCAMRTAKKRDPEHVFCVINVVGGVDADLKSLAILVGLVRHNKYYATRTGVYGANFFMQAFVDIATKAAGRKNMKLFSTKQQAEHWVKTGRKVSEAV